MSKSKLISYLTYGANLLVGNPVGGLVGFGGRLAEDTGFVKENSRDAVDLTRTGFALLSGLSAVYGIRNISHLNIQDIYNVLGTAGNAALFCRLIADTNYWKTKSFGNFTKDIKKAKDKIADLEKK